MADPILDLLNNAELRTLVVTTLADTCCLARTIYDNPPEDMQNLKGEDLWEEAWRRAQTSRGRDVLKAFEENLFAKVAKPFRITPQETWDAFWAVAEPLEHRMPDDDSEYTEGMYTAFVNFIGNRLLSRNYSSPLTVARICPQWLFCIEQGSIIICARPVFPANNDGDDLAARWHHASDDRAASLVLEPEYVWDPGGVWIEQVASGPCTDMEYGEDDFHYLNVRVGGSMSEGALADLTGELTSLLPSVIRSVTVVQEGPTATYEDPFVFECKRRLPVITEALLGKNIHFLRRCLDAYFSNPSKKDCMERRIRNAISLLAESDTQPHDAVGLALAIAAIEALLGEKGESVSERLSGNLAVLLEPDPEMRVKARKLFKDLYALRSDALHGRQPENVREHRIKARCVAAAVLHSVISRQDFLLRGGFHPEHPQELLRDLENLHWSAGQPMGVSVLPAVTRLWR